MCAPALHARFSVQEGFRIYSTGSALGVRCFKMRVAHLWHMRVL